jgi:hypothetical protein
MFACTTNAMGRAAAVGERADSNNQYHVVAGSILTPPTPPAPSSCDATALRDPRGRLQRLGFG